MTIIDLIPYEIIENQEYQTESKFLIKNDSFNKIDYKSGTITFSFINCRFSELEIENPDYIDFPSIIIQFINCYIKKINVENISSSNISVFIGSSIFQGQFKSSRLKDVTINNCLLVDSVFLMNQNSINITYTEENIFPKPWKTLIKSINTSFEKLLEYNQSYFIYDSKNITFNVSENKNEKSGLYKRLYSPVQDNKIGIII